MKKVRNNSSLLTKYTLMYEKKPRSRVFAPLAESYRKLGMYKEAFKFLNEGIKNHPTYTLGYVVLANCYFDNQNYEMAYNTLRPFVSQNLENIRMQKIFGNSCMHLGYLEEALQTFKYLLLINPKDVDAAKQVKLLEDDLSVQEALTNEKEFAPQPDSIDFTSEDDWVQVNFGQVKDQNLSEEQDENNWQMGVTSPLEHFKQEVKDDQIAVKEHELDDNYYHEDYDNFAEAPIEPGEELTDGPIITHTLVDLYCQQGHFAQAASILESILELHPDDEFTRKKLDEITMHLVKDSLETGEVEADTEDSMEVGLAEPSEEKGSEKIIMLLQDKLDLYFQTLKRISQEKLT